MQVGPSPLWLKARLMAAGQRPISNVVDITNYVMLLLGQPMHAYDLDRVAGPALHVRAAREGERLTTLDGEERVFDGDAVLVCDADGPTGIGGIMGGAAQRGLREHDPGRDGGRDLERHQHPETSKKLGLRTEASTRFEKQLHPALALQAQRLAARLMVELCGARMVPGTVDVAAPEPEPHRVVAAQRRGSTRCSASAIEPEESQAILERLGFGVERRDGDLEAEVPYFRHYDVYREADLIEEVARIHGLQRLPATLPARRHAVGGAVADAEAAARRSRTSCAGAGLSEVVTFSFVSPEAVRRLRVAAGDVRARVLPIANPLSEEQSVMRTTLAPGPARGGAPQRRPRHAGPVAVRERAACSSRTGATTLPDERLHLGVLLAGDFQPGDVAAAGPAGRLLRGQGVAGGRARGARRALAPDRRRPAVPASGPCGRGGGRRPRGGLARRAASGGRAPTSASTTWSGRRPCWSSISTSCCRPPSGSRAATRT